MDAWGLLAVVFALVILLILSSGVNVFLIICIALILMYISK